MMSVYLTPLGPEHGNLHVTARARVPSAAPGQRNSVSFLHSSQLRGELGGQENKGLAWYLERCWSREPAWRKEGHGRAEYKIA